MPQTFKRHSLALAPAPARAQSRAAQLADTATEYFAYITLLTVAVGVAVATMAFSANVAVRWLDTIAKPGYFDHDVRPASAPVDTAPANKAAKRAQFAMLPAAMPIRMKDDVISSNY